MRLIALDISTKTGYAIFDDGKPVSYGLIKAKPPDFKMNVSRYTDYPESYPYNIIDTARRLAIAIAELVDNNDIDLVVIEDTSKSRQRFTQRLLEFYHFAICDLLRYKRVVYLTQNCWRRAVGAFATPEEKEHNKKLKKARTANSKLLLDGKGQLKTKHFSIRVVKERLGIDLLFKDNDIADALCLGMAAVKLKLGVSDETGDSDTTTDVL